MPITTGNNVGSVQLTSVPLDAANVEAFTDGQHSYMRPRTITFTATGLKPNTRYWPFFNNVFVGWYCSTLSNPTMTPVGVTSSHQVLKTNAIGNLVGNFFLPAGKFVVGSHIFKLVDNWETINSVAVPAPIYGSAEAIYESNYVLKQQQSQMTGDGGVVLSSNNTPVSDGYWGGDAVEDQVVARPVQICESWFFEYVVTGINTLTFTVTTASSIAPGEPGSPDTAPTYRGGSGTSQDSGTITYISTSSRADDAYDHLFSYTTEDVNKTYRKEWVGLRVSPDTNNVHTATLNYLNTTFPTASMRPSGLAESATYDVVLGWTRLGVVACPVSVGTKTVTRSDAIAQSIYVDSSVYPKGMYVTSVDLFFRTVDHATPVSVELRDMTNGIPGSNILPGGTSLLPGYAVTASVDGTMPTTFRFDQPIFLRPGVEYALVVKSSSLGYAVWCSRLGEADVASGRIIDSQPFEGVLFKTENDSTWVPDPLEDLKFDLYKADFDTTATASIKLRPQQFTAEYDSESIDNYYSTGQVLPLSFISTLLSSAKVTIRIPNHGMLSNDYLLIDNVPTPSTSDAYNGITVDQLEGKHQVTVVDDDFVHITIAGASANRTGSIAIADNTTALNIIPSVMPSTVDPVEVVQWVDPNNSSPSTIPTTTLGTDPLVQPTVPSITTANAFTVYTNVKVGELMVDYMGTTPDDTDVVETVNLAKDDYSPPVSFEVDRTNFTVPIDGTTSFVGLIATPLNEAFHDDDLNFETSLEVDLELSSENKDLSPVIDMNGASVVVRTYRINNQPNALGDPELGTTQVDLDAISLADKNDATINSEINSGTGNAVAKYKGPVVQLTELYDQLQVFVSASIPSPCLIDVYARTSNDEFTHADQNWTFLEAASADNVEIPTAADTLERYYVHDPIVTHTADVLEFGRLYTIKALGDTTNWVAIGAAEAVVGTVFRKNEVAADGTGTGTATTREIFNVFDVKVVMRSTNSAVVPKIYGVRAIAGTATEQIE